MKLKVTHDVYDITNRIKSIDRDYYFIFDTSKKVYELHNSNQIGSSYCLTLPYESLDERAINLALQTSIKNIEKIFKKIDYDNKILENAEKSRVFSRLDEIIN